MFSNQDQVIKLYSFSEETKEFTGEFDYFWAKGTGYAANSTDIKPLNIREDFAIIYDTDAKEWFYIEDHRGEKAFSKETQQELEINELGAIKSEFTLLKPGSIFETWDGESWADQRTSQEIKTYNRSLLPRLSKRQFALYLYDNEMYEPVMAAIEANPRFKIEYDSVSDIERLSPTVSEMTSLLGWTEDQVDQMWTEALTL